MPPKKRRRYKLLEPLPVEQELPPRVVAVVTVFQWMLWFAMAGVLVAFCLVLSLELRWHVSTQLWLRLWPASVQLMTADPSRAHMTRLALWTTTENGIMYGGVGVVIGLGIAWARGRK